MGRLDMVRKLLNKYQRVEDIGDPQYVDEKGYGAIHYATVHQELDVLKILLDKDKSLLLQRTTDGQNNSIAHLAAKHNCLNILKYLVNN
jgi:hypothetical protein